VEWVAPVSNVIGKLAAWITRRERCRALTHIALEMLAQRLATTGSKNAAPDAFLLEIYNPDPEVIRMQLGFSAVPSEPNYNNGLVQLSKGFMTTIVCPRGYSRHEIDMALLRSTVESGVPFLVRLVPEADTDARLVFLSANFVKFAARLQDSDPRKVKCLVFDLDNTLWKGILVEGDEVVLQPEIKQLIKHLDERGILLSIASKNDREAAWKKLEELGLSQYFLYPQINWNPKSQNIKTIADRLNIGIDALAFIDDNPFELDEVTRSLPETICINSADAVSLFSDPRFRGSATHDARRRRQLYRDAEAREVAQESFGSDYVGFLASCEIKLEISAYFPEDSERVAELVQRTNQLNFSGRKHTRQGLEKILSNSLLDKFVLKSSDRYGSHGTIGFCAAERAANAILIHELMLSCRVQGKLLEKAFFQHLLEHHFPDSRNKLWIDFRKTARNVPAQLALESMGFRPCDASTNEFSHGMILTSSELLHSDVIRVNCSCLLSQPSTTHPALSSTM
jgi:FkbH-like protein